MGDQGGLQGHLSPECHPQVSAHPTPRASTLPLGAASCLVPSARDPSPVAALATVVAEHPSGPHPRSPLAQLHRCPSSPALASYLLWGGQTLTGHRQTGSQSRHPGDWRGPETPRHSHSPGSLRLDHPLLTLQPSSGRAKALCQRCQGFLSWGRVTLLLLRVCRRVLDGRRSEIITGSGSGSTRSRQVGGFAQHRWQPRNFKASPVPRQLKGSAAPCSCWRRAELLRHPKRRMLGTAPLGLSPPPPGALPRVQGGQRGAAGSSDGRREQRRVAGAPALAGEEPHGRDWRA